MLIAPAHPATEAHVHHHAKHMAKATASYYGPGLYGGPLACGGTLQPGTIGVANKSLRCWTKLKLCYRRCVRAAVIDRGPYVAGRTFDLTDATRQAVGMPKGVVTLRYRIAG